MVDPYQVIIDNGNKNSNHSDRPNASASLTHAMNEFDPLKSEDDNLRLLDTLDTATVPPKITTNQSEQHTQHEVNASCIDNLEHVFSNNQTYDDIMCGPSSRHGIEHTIQQNSDNIDDDLTNELMNSASIFFQNGVDIESGADNVSDQVFDATDPSNEDIYAIVNNRLLYESNDTFTRQPCLETTSINIDLADVQVQAVQPAESTGALDNQIAHAVHDQSNEMDSRKVEPLRINISRDAIKTIIKLNANDRQQQQQTVEDGSPKSSSSPLNTGDDDFDDIDMEEPTATTYPKIKIKPVKPPPENDYRPNHSTTTTTQEAIPKLKIKKIDLTSSTLEHVSCSNSTKAMSTQSMLRNNDSTNNTEQLYQINHHHHHSESDPYSVPKSATLRDSAATNSSIGSSSDDLSETASTSEIVPKLTIKLDNHQYSPMQSDSTTREVTHLVSNDGVKVTLKPIAEPRVPKLTIKTNAFNDRAKVVVVKSAANEQTDESSDEQPSQPPSSQPSPSDKISSLGDYPTHRISSTSSPYQGQHIDDNLSTCSSGSSSSSYSSHSSGNTPNNDIKLIIKATSTGSCVVNPNTSSIARSSPSTTRAAVAFKTNSKAGISDQHKTNNSIVNMVTSSNTNSNDAIPKLNIKLSTADYPQVIHNDETDSESARTASPLPKLTIRMQSADAEPSSKLTPKIILKSIPKPIDKPLEINTSPGSPFRSTGEHEGQQSPRIILKINKTTTSQSKETKSVLSSTTIITEEPANQSGDQQSSTSHNEHKRTTATGIDSSHQKRRRNTNDVDDDDIVQLLSSDSDFEEVSHSKSNSSSADVIKSTTTATQSSSSFDSNSGLRSILTRPQKKIQPQPLQNCLQASPAFRSANELAAKDATTIDMYQTGGDRLSSVSSSNDDGKASTMVIDANAKTSAEKRHFIWQYLNTDSAKEQPPLPVHPLVQYDTERANILAAMMDADKSRENSSNGSSSNNNTVAKSRNDMNQLLKSGVGLLENDGSSSDCIMIDDKSSESCATTGFMTIEQQNAMGIIDSGLDASLLGSNNEGGDDITPVAKRPRGRPRKTPVADTPPPTKTKSTKKRQLAKELSKRKFAASLLAHEDDNMNAMYEENSTSMDTTEINMISEDLLGTPSNSIACAVSESLDNPIILDESTQENAASMDGSTESQSAIPSLLTTPPSVVPDFTTPHMDANESLLLDDSHVIDTMSPSIGNDSMSTAIVTTPSTSAMKDRKRRIVVDDDDESPTFNPLRSSKKRGKNSRSRKSLLNRKQRKIQLLSPTAAASMDKVDERAMFTSPEGIELRKVIAKDAIPCPLQIFEEDTQMSADSLLTSSANRAIEIVQNDESQSSLHSSTSATVESSARKFRSKIEVVDPEGRTEFTVDLIAEYDWPPPKGCCPSRQRDSFMIQEQIAEYLGVKSFKRKYPDLPRRMVEMEERNYLMEKGLVSEKMCDLGLTAVSASDILDIMHTDFYEKYDEYRRYARERQLKELAARQKQMQVGGHGKGMSARENAIRAASSWNVDFNRSRTDNRRECLDLQSFVVQTTEAYRYRQNCPPATASQYPVALVPGQFQENYRQYTAAELLCYPLNTVLANPHTLDTKLREYYEKLSEPQCISDDSGSDCDSDCSDCSSDSGSSGSSEDSNNSSDENDMDDDKANIRLHVVPKDENNANAKNSNIHKADRNERKKCRVCDGIERCNPQSKPEIFVECSKCRRTAHPTCLKMSTRMVRRVNEYAWQCKDCRMCMKCHRSEDDDKLMSCDQCDRQYHIYCVGQRRIPEEKWHCAVCTICTLCGARRPEGHNNPNLTPQQKQKLLAVAKWTHEYLENPVTKELEHQLMLCTSCVALKNSSAKNIYFN